MGCHSFLQGIFLTQGLNSGLLHCRQILYHLSHQESIFTIFIVKDNLRFKYKEGAQKLKKINKLDISGKRVIILTDKEEGRTPRVCLNWLLHQPPACYTASWHHLGVRGFFVYFPHYFFTFSQALWEGFIHSHVCLSQLWQVSQNTLLHFSRSFTGPGEMNLHSRKLVEESV